MRCAGYVAEARSVATPGPRTPHDWLCGPALPPPQRKSELRLESAWLNPLTHPRAAQLVADGALSLDRLITRTISLDEVPAAIAGAPVFGEIKLIMAG